MADDYKIAQPLEYFKHFLKENIRPDGRQLTEFRRTVLNVGTVTTARGSAVLKLGHTMVVCGVTAELAEPTAEHPKRGYFVPNVELPPLCSLEFRPGPPDDKAQVLSQTVLDLVSSSNLLNLEELCIEEKKLVWVLYADIVCLSHDGNLMDAVTTVLYAALKNTKLPLITLNEETKQPEHHPHEHFHLNLLTKPVSTTIAIFDDDVLLVDPNHEEEDVSSGCMTIVCGDGKQLYAVHKHGGCAVNDLLLNTCMKHAMERHAQVSKLLDTVEEDVDR